MARHSQAQKRARIEDLYDAGVPIKSIAAECDVGMSSVYAVVGERPPRHTTIKHPQYARPVAAGTPARRRCLCCQRVFQSVWIGNRLCIACR